MLNLRKVAVTGGLSSGKTTVCHIFKEFGAYVVSADEIVHQLLSPDTDLGQQIIGLLGSDIVVNKKMVRSQIAKKVFDNPGLLQSLEKILHPAVQNEIRRQYEHVRNNGTAPLFVAEIPLLFEGNFNHYDATIAVIASKEKSKKRFIRTTGYNEEEFDKRMARQLQPEEKARRADYVISNDGSLDDLHALVAAIYNKLIV